MRLTNLVLHVECGCNKAHVLLSRPPSKHTSIGPMLALYWRVPFVPATVQTVLSQYTGHTVIKVDVLACIGPALARLYRPSIDPLVLARYQPGSTLFRKMSQVKFFMAPPRECNFTAKLRGLSSTRRRHFCEIFGSGICSGKLQ